MPLTFWINIATANAQQSLSFDYAARNALPFTGFGAQIWPQATNIAARDAAIATLHIRYVRAALNTGLPPGLLQGHMSVANIEALLTSQAESEEVAAASAALRAFAIETATNNLIVHYVHFSPPPDWRVASFVWNGVQEYAISDAHVQDYANLVVAEIRNATRNGVRVSFAEPTNEPDGGWDAQFTPAQYDRFINDVTSDLLAGGPHAVRIEGPGTSSVASAGPFLAAMQADGTLAKIDAISVHDYDAAPLPSIEGLTPLGASPASFGHAFFVTELGSNSATFAAPPYTSPPSSISGSNPSVWSTQFAVAETAEALKCLGDGASAPLLWQLQDVYWDPTGWGLLDVHGNWKPTAQAASAILGHLVPGSVTVRGQGLTSGLTGTALVWRATTLVAISNLNTSAVQLQTTLSNFPPWRTISVRAAYPPGTRVGPILQTGTTASFTIPPTSVVLLRAAP